MQHASRRTVGPAAANPLDAHTGGGAGIAGVAGRSPRHAQGGERLPDGKHSGSTLTIRQYLSSSRFQRHALLAMLFLSLLAVYTRTPSTGSTRLDDEIREARMRQVESGKEPTVYAARLPTKSRMRKRTTTQPPLDDGDEAGDEEDSMPEPFDDADAVAEAQPQKPAAKASVDVDIDGGDSDEDGGDDGDSETGMGSKNANQAEPKEKTFRNKLGEWQWLRKSDGTAVWRKLAKDGSNERPERTWYDRSTVQSRLDFEKYVKCLPKPDGDLPPIDDLPVTERRTVLDEYIVHQGNFQRLGKGSDVNRTQRIRNVEALPLDGENTLRSHNWGNCAIVGNSGILRLEEVAKSIDSHDTVVRLNHAPTYGYSRRVGRKVTHRFLNRLWTRTYRNGGGMKRGTVLPMEKDLTFVVTRATSQEYELLLDYLLSDRPDVKVLYLSSRATSMATPLLTKYRERLCKHGYGPYKGLNVPSSGFVAIYMLIPLCDRITVYGFGVEGMMNVKNLKFDDSYGYHYFKGVGSRHVGDDVHSFDNEEMVLRAMDKAGVLDMCQFVNPKNNTKNWACGCRAANVMDCKPAPGKNGLPRTDDLDCDVDDCVETTEATPAKGGHGAAKGATFKGAKDKGRGEKGRGSGRTRL